MALLQYNFTVDVIVYFETKILMLDLKIFYVNDFSKDVYR